MDRRQLEAPTAARFRTYSFKLHKVWVRWASNSARVAQANIVLSFHEAHLMISISETLFYGMSPAHGFGRQLEPPTQRSLCTGSLAFLCFTSPFKFGLTTSCGHALELDIFSVMRQNGHVLEMEEGKNGVA